jgi:hypothetical protein
MIVNNTFSFSVETALPPNTRMQSDRFAREIVAILVLSDAARLRRLMRSPLGAQTRSSLSHQWNGRRIRFVFVSPEGW